MPERPEVLVIGAGVIGASVAYHLTRAGCRDVMVLDRGATAAEGSTGRATGGFRAQFASEVNIRLSLLSRQLLATFPDDVGVESGYNPVGYLFLARNTETLLSLGEAQRLQHRCGLGEAAMISAGEARAINPHFRDEAVIGAAWCPSDGFIKPLEILRGYREAASRMGAVFRFAEEVQVIEYSSRRITRVRTTSGELEPRFVVNAAGPWASSVARLAGVDLPVVALKRQVAATKPTSLLPPDMPMTIWMEDGFHLRVRDGRVLLLRPSDPELEGLELEEAWLQQTVRQAHVRFPQLREIAIDRQASWCGYYEMSPDGHAFIGTDDLENLFFANGSSGHGVMHAPALGLLLAEMILEGKAKSLDVSSLRLSRFREGKAVKSVSLL